MRRGPGSSGWWRGLFGSGYVSVPRMARVGVVLDLAAALLAGLWCWLVVGRVL